MPRREIIDVSKLKLHPAQERRQRRLRALRVAAEREKPTEPDKPERIEPRRYMSDDPVDST